MKKPPSLIVLLCISSWFLFYPNLSRAEEVTLNPPPWKTKFTVSSIFSVDSFYVVSDDDDLIELAKAELSKPIFIRKPIQGVLQYGAGELDYEFNEPFNWHIPMNEWELGGNFSSSCNATPSDVEMNVTYWVGNVGRFCPQDSYISAYIDSGLPIWFIVIQWGIIVVLLCLSGLFSGMTLGVLGLDLITLEILIESGTKADKKSAKKVQPLRKRGNLLLCTFLIGNVAVNSLLSILMASYTSGLVGFFVSTIAIVILGEIFPQAICCRYGLVIGAKLVGVVWFFLILFFPISWPISLVLDKLLGNEIGAVYAKNEIKRLLTIHGSDREGDLTKEETTIMMGALEFARKLVGDISTPIDKVEMLDINTPLNQETLTKILSVGFTRIPVYSGSRSNIVGLLVVKDLALLPQDQEEMPSLKSIVELYGHKLPKVFADAYLEELLRELKLKKSHMALVQKICIRSDVDPYYENIGIVTIEDVLEEIIQEEILDESDVSSLDYKTLKFQDTETKLLPGQIDAIYALLSSFKEFSPELISEKVCKKLIAQSDLLDFHQKEDDRDKIFLYKRGKQSTAFHVMLEGRVEILSGAEGFLSYAHQFSVLGLQSLTSEAYIPDFSAYVIGDVICLRIHRGSYQRSIKASKLGSPSTRRRNDDGTLNPHADGHASSSINLHSHTDESSPLMHGHTRTPSTSASSALLDIHHHADDMQVRLNLSFLKNKKPPTIQGDIELDVMGPSSSYQTFGVSSNKPNSIQGEGVPLIKLN